MAATEIIDWRNEPDRVIDILGPRILLSADSNALERSQLEEIDPRKRKSVLTHDPEVWLQNFITTSAQAIQFEIEVIRFEYTKSKSKWPTAIRLGMDRNNALPAHPVIALEPYLFIAGSGNYIGEITKFKDFDPIEHKYSRPFGYLYALSKQHVGTSPRNQPDMLELAKIVDVIEDISWAVKEALQGQYDTENGILVAYNHPNRGIITLDTDYSVSRQNTGRAYGAWNSDGGFLL